ncbi:MAG: hypothetical protein E6296_06635 [Anaerococcus vaginalis]|nr:hypothetical protein [Anaerococcus vaginalis]
MKISELKTIAKENDYELKEEKEIEQITLERKVTFDGFISNVITISLIKKNLIFIKSKHCDNKDFNMIKAAVEFAETPIKDREEEKKFWIQHKFMVSKNLLPVNLVWNKLKDVYRSINLKVDSHIYQAQFTFKEYEEIKKKLNTDLKDFELVEVKE